MVLISKLATIFKKSLIMDRSKFKATMIEVTYKEIITSDFNDIRNYLDHHSNFHKTELGELNKIIEMNYDDEHIHHVVDIYNDFNRFNQILYSSQVVVIYSLLEFWILRIAKKVEDRTQSKIKLKDLRENSDLERARKYINLIGDIEFDDLNESWKEILNYRVVRNLIVHNGYNLFKHQIIKTDEKKFLDEEKKALKIINDNEYLTVDLKSGSIFISNQNFTVDFSILSEKFLHNLLNKIVLKYSC